MRSCHKSRPSCAQQPATTATHAHGAGYAAIACNQPSRDPNFRSLTLSDLEWLVLPAVMVGQFDLAHAPMQRPVAKAEKSCETQQNGAALVPVAVALWARDRQGANVFIGGGGSDTLNATVDNLRDTMDGGEGTDTANYAA